MHPSVICTVDVVLLTLKDEQLHVALFPRANQPFGGAFALPGGYVRAQEDQSTRDAALRVLREKTGLTSVFTEQLATFSGPSRDPRGWSLSVAYYALVPLDELEAAGPKGLQLHSATNLGFALPFDHADIVKAAVERVRNKASYSSLPVHLCGKQFTLPQLQAVYEQVLGEPINKVSFRRKMAEMNLLEEIPGAMEEGRANRPAQLYQLKPQFTDRLSVTDRALNPG